MAAEKFHKPFFLQTVICQRQAEKLRMQPMTKAPDTDLVFVFDVAGVLVEWDIKALYRPWCERSGHDLDQIVNHVLGSETQAEISKGYPVEPLLDALKKRFPEWQAEIAAYWTNWEEMLAGVISGTVSVAEELKERGHSLYVLGNWGREEFERAKPKMAFIEMFDGILLSGDCGILKPDPEIFRLAEEKFDLVPAKTVFIDDRKENVHAAIHRGWNGIVFENPRQLYLTLMEYAML